MPGHGILRAPYSLLDAHHATGDETFHRAAERTGLALVEAQLPVGDAAGRGTRHSTPSAAAGEEAAGASGVLGEPGTVRHMPFQQAFSTAVDQQEAHHQGADDRRGGHSRGVADDQEQAPPDTEVTEVVGVPGPAPQAAVHDAALVRRVRLEPGELPVAHRLEEEADQPERPARVGDGSDRATDVLGRLHGQRDQQDQRTLEQIDHAQGVHLRTAGRPGEHRRIARVLAVAASARGDVDSEPQAPDSRQHGDQNAPNVVALAGRQHVGDEGDRSEGNTPGDVDDAVQALRDGDPEGDEHDREGGARRGAHPLTEHGPRKSVHRTPPGT